MYRKLTLKNLSVAFNAIIMIIYIVDWLVSVPNYKVIENSSFEFIRTLFVLQLIQI